MAFKPYVAVATPAPAPAPASTLAAAPEPSLYLKPVDWQDTNEVEYSDIMRGTTKAVFNLTGEFVTPLYNNDILDKATHKVKSYSVIYVKADTNFLEGTDLKTLQCQYPVYDWEMKSMLTDNGNLKLKVNGNIAKFNNFNHGVQINLAFTLGYYFNKTKREVGLFMNPLMIE